MRQDEIDAINGVGQAQVPVDPVPPPDVYEQLLALTQAVDRLTTAVNRIETRVDEAITKFIGSPGKVMGGIVAARLKGIGKP